MTDEQQPDTETEVTDQIADEPEGDLDGEMSVEAAHNTQRATGEGKIHPQTVKRVVRDFYRGIHDPAFAIRFTNRGPVVRRI